MDRGESCENQRSCQKHKNKQQPSKCEYTRTPAQTTKKQPSTEAMLGAAETRGAKYKEQLKKCALEELTRWGWRGESCESKEVAKSKKKQRTVGKEAAVSNGVNLNKKKRDNRYAHMTPKVAYAKPNRIIDLQKIGDRNSPAVVDKRKKKNSTRIGLLSF